MKLSGNYSFEDLARTLQGNFSCQSVTKNSNGKPLGENSRITLELFFLRIDIFYEKNSPEIKVYSVSEDQNGQKLLKPLVTIAGK